jgi:predicted transposase YdaD
MGIGYDCPMPLTHDQFFRHVFSQRSHVIAFLSGVLGSIELACLDLENLRQLPDTYVTARLRRRVTDAVWQCPLITPEGSLTGEEVRICILIEHKSRRDPFPYPQLLHYIAVLWQRQFREEGRIHPILPILFHQGAHPHRLHPLQDHLSALPAWLAPLTPLFGYRLADLPSIPVERLTPTFGDPVLSLDLTAMKYAVERLPARSLVEQFLAVPRKVPLGDLEPLLSYIEERGGLSPQDLETMAQARPPVERKKIMTLKEQLIQIGIKQGLEQGLEQGREQGREHWLREAKREDARKMKEHGIALPVIAEITGLSPAEVEQL